MQIPGHNRQLVDLWEIWDWGDRDNSFCFDYHFMWPCMGDLLSVDLAPLMPQDIEDYDSMGLGGLMNRGSQRTFYPTGWQYWETARLLCGEELGPEDREHYFRLWYGEDSDRAMALLNGIPEVTGAPRHGGVTACFVRTSDRLLALVWAEMKLAEGRFALDLPEDTRVLDTMGNSLDPSGQVAISKAPTYVMAPREFAHELREALRGAFAG